LIRGASRPSGSHQARRRARVSARARARGLAEQESQNRRSTPCTSDAALAGARRVVRLLHPPRLRVLAAARWFCPARGDRGRRGKGKKSTRGTSRAAGLMAPHRRLLQTGPKARPLAWIDAVAPAVLERTRRHSGARPVCQTMIEGARPAVQSRPWRRRVPVGWDARVRRFDRTGVSRRTPTHVGPA